MMPSMMVVLLVGAASALAPPEASLVVSEVRGASALRTWRREGGGALRRVPTPTTARAGAWARSLRGVFVPSTTVAPEYLAYQRWHVAQDLATQLRSTLATSAVFRGLGVGSTAASPLAATVAWLARDASGMVASLAATSALAPRLGGDARRWRFVGDVAVDGALLLELATARAPRRCFLPLLCAASVLKALCGVCAGGANAAIAAHWAATAADYAEVSAKGGAVGTVSGLLGLGLSLLGSALVGRATLTPAAEARAVWATYGVLTAVHVHACAAGLSLLAFESLGCPRRYARAAAHYAATGAAPTPAALGAADPVVGRPDAGRGGSAAVLAFWRRDPDRVGPLLAREELHLVAQQQHHILADAHVVDEALSAEQLLAEQPLGRRRERRELVN